MTDLDVIMLTRGHPEWVLRATTSLKRQGIPWSGWLVDNSKDGSAKAVAKECGWNYLTKKRNVSFSEANNWAVSKGRGSWLLFLNDDAILWPFCLRRMLEHDEPIVGPIQHFEGGLIFQAGHRSVTVTQPDGKQITGWPWDHHRVQGLVNEGCFETEALAFSIALIHRSVYEELGGLDEGYIWSYDDIDFSLRARAAGYRLMVCAEAHATHEQGGTRGKDTYDAEMLSKERITKQWSPAKVAALPPIRLAPFPHDMATV